MSTMKLGAVWWLCMVPSFAATAMLLNEWLQNQSETRFLLYALICLLLGVIFGAIIVLTSQSKDSAEGKQSENPPLSPISSALREEPLSQHHNFANAESSTGELATEPELSAQNEDPSLSPEAIYGGLAGPDSIKDMQALNATALNDTTGGDESAERRILSCLENEVLKVEATSALVAEQESGKKPFPEFDGVDNWMKYAELMIAEDNQADAIKCYDKVTELDPKNFDAWFLKGRALRTRGQTEDAIYCINYALRLRENCSVALSEKALCLLDLGRAEQALPWFDKSLALDDIAVRPWLGKGQCLSALGKHKDAITCYDKVLLLQPDNDQALRSRSESVAKTGAKT
ncbi:MAG: tetratricopeptide repeat protein [Candidatus Obscuribacterales bacterium]|nr:tetratricopeptide repeat protein [Candidatus Obscuribacterales bacterium]